MNDENNTLTSPETVQPATTSTPQKKGPYRGIDNKMLRYSLILDNLKAVDEAKKLAQDIGYPPAKVKEGTALFDRCIELIEQHEVSKGRKQSLNKAFKAAKAELHREYMYQLTVTRRVLAGNSEHLQAIRAIGQRANRFSRWLEDVRIFYENILQSPEILAVFAGTSLDEKQFKATQKKVTDLTALNMDRHQQNTETQGLTREKQEALEALEKWVNAFQEVARSRYLKEPAKRLVLGV